jgi:ABC-type branched-subunit amino acid transport system substrate-binding protein
VSTSRALKDRRFVNAYQAANGLAPGIYAAEAWDAGEMVAHPLERGIHDRSGMNAAIAGLQTWDGVSGLLRFDFDGELVRPQVGLFVATGTRWLPLGR